MSLKLAALILSLGLDTLTVAVALGLSGIGRTSRIKVGVSFALFEGLMPLLGFLIGQGISGVVGKTASLVGIAGLPAMGVYMVYESLPTRKTDISTWGAGEGCWSRRSRLAWTS